MTKLNYKLNPISNRRVVLIDEITSSKSDGLGLTDEIPKYSHYLCFTVSVRTNKFALKQLDRYSPEQQELHDKIKSLYESGMSYRKITKHLNDKFRQFTLVENLHIISLGELF